MADHDQAGTGAPAMTDAERDGLCRRCGRCCCRKFVLRDIVYYTPFYCPHLDPASRLCTVYGRRFQVNPNCLTVERSLARGVFPADCPYVAGRSDYCPPVETLDFFGLGKLARQIAEELEISDEEFERVRRQEFENRGKPQGAQRVTDPS